MAKLSIEVLTKRNNFSLFKTRIAARQSFMLAESNGKKIKIDPQVAKNLKTVSDIEKYRVGRSIVFPTTLKGQVRLTQLYKDEKFVTRTQDTLAAEKTAIRDVRVKLKQIKDLTGSDFVNLQIGKKYYKISNVINTPGFVKSDFHFVDENGKMVGFVSHKDGTTARAIQQWGGLSQSVEPVLASNKETQDFVATIREMYPNGMPSATTVARKINDNKLKMQAVYGNEYGGESSPQNVDLLLQGVVDIRRMSTGKYKLVASAKTYNNGDSVMGNNEPFFMAIYKDRNDYGVKNARIVISPRGGRSIKKYV